MAQVIFTVAEQNDGAARRLVERLLEELVAAGVIHRVVEGRAASGAELAHPVSQRFGVVGEVLRDLWRHVEADDKSEIKVWAHRLVEKLNG